MKTKKNDISLNAEAGMKHLAIDSKAVIFNIMN